MLPTSQQANPNRQKINILGVNISCLSYKDTLKTIQDHLSHSKFSRPFFITTPNPEMLVLAHKDNHFKDILNTSDLAVPDGMGVVWAGRLLSKFPVSNFQFPNENIISSRVAGTDLMLSLCETANNNGYTVGLLGGRDNATQKTAEVLRERFPKLKIVFAVEEISNLGNLSNLRKNGPDLLFVAFGAPKQEEFLYEWIYNKQEGKRYKLKSIKFKVGMGVGGAFDLIGGKIQRAPVWMRNIGLEWLFRLIQEPWRIGRIITATIIFPVLVVLSLCDKSISNK